MPQRINSGQVMLGYTRLSQSNGTATRQNITVSNTQITNMSLNYTSGKTNELLDIRGSVLMSNTAAGSGIYLAIGGAFVAPRSYTESLGYFRHQTGYLYEIAANTTITISLRVIPGGTATVANGNGDGTPGYLPLIELITWGRL